MKRKKSEFPETVRLSGRKWYRYDGEETKAKDRGLKCRWVTVGGKAKTKGSPGKATRILTGATVQLYVSPRPSERGK